MGYPYRDFARVITELLGSIPSRPTASGMARSAYKGKIVKPSDLHP